MKNLFFLNFNCHYGDLHCYREFIKDIINKTDFDEYYLLQDHISNKLLSDIPKLKFDKINKNCHVDNMYYQINKDVYVNLHYATYNPFASFIITDWDKYSSLILAYHEYYSFIYNKLQILIDYPNYYIPSIDYSKFDLTNINNYLIQEKFRVLVCNGPSLSAQSSNNINFLKIIGILSDNYPNIDFILTDKIEISKNNVLFTDDIIKNDRPDLNEISYLSTKCSIIIGKSSGPSCYAITKENFDDVNKTFISIAKDYKITFYAEFSKINKILINNFDDDNILEIINKEIEKKFHFYKNKLIESINIKRNFNRIDFSSSYDLYNIRISTYIDLNDNGEFGIAYGTYFELIAKNINYFIILNRLINENTKVKIKFFYYQEFLFETIT